MNPQNTPTASTARGRRGQGGPPLLAPGLAYVALTVASVALSAGTPRPGTVLAYQQAHPTLVQVAAFLQLASAVPLAIWSATVYRRLRILGINAPGPAMGFAGGIMGAGLTAMLGAIGWATSQTAGVTTPSLAAWSQALTFAIGSAGFVPALGLLVAGVAVPGWLGRLLPRWIAIPGVVIGAIGMLSTFTALTSALAPTLPIGRFGGLLFIIAASVALPLTRGQVGRRGAAVTAGPVGARGRASDAVAAR